jgi:hypothetical protein
LAVTQPIARLRDGRIAMETRRDKLPDHHRAEPSTLLLEDQSLAGGFVQLPKRILYARNLSRDAKLLYAVLLGYAWQADRCFPGYRCLCADLGASENMVRKYVRELERVQLLRQKRRGLGKTNLYLLCDLRTAQLAGPEPQEQRHPARTAQTAVPEPHFPASPDHREVPPSDRQPAADDRNDLEQEAEKKKQDQLESFEGPSPSAFSDDDGRHIQQLIADFSRELDDVVHLRSNLTRALRLWQHSGLDAQEFAARAYDAKQLTRLYQGKQPPGTRIEAKGAYFFTVLEQLISHDAGRRQEHPGRAPPPPSTGMTRSDDDHQQGVAR